MPTKLKILMLEDSATDAELLRTMLQRSGLDFDWVCVENESGFKRELDAFEPNIVLSDYNLPAYDGGTALQHVLATHPHLPVIIVTGALGEEKAVQLLRDGAVDYILKDRLARLPDAVKRALGNSRVAAERLVAQGKLVESDRLLRQAQEIAHLGSLRWELAEDLIYCSEEAYRIFGLLPDESGHEPRSFFEQVVLPSDYEFFWKEIQDTRAGKSEFNCEVRFRRPTGEMRWVHGQARIICDEAGKPAKLIAALLDITERKATESRILYMANHDALTGLPNREQLYANLGSAINSSNRNNHGFALMFLDLDHFKDINDTLGHDVGDRLLVEMSQRLLKACRSEDTVSRLGGDEFILLLPESDEQGAAQAANKLLAIVSRPFMIDLHEINVTGSIGIAIYPIDGENIDQLSRHADAAMYRAKEDGRNAFRFFTKQMQEHSARNLLLVNALSHAIVREQLEVYFQPQIITRDRTVVGAEALLRWQHPELGAVSPGEFIRLAEDSGLILQIGEWVLRQAIRQAKRWQDQGFAPLLMAVNLSAVQFHQPELPQLVARILKEEGLSPAYLELELTESVTMRDPLAAIDVIKKLHEQGIHMSIDDFGTGYSSLNYLKKFQVSRLKIDQSFIRDLCVDPEDMAIVSAIISMSHSLGFETIAEGVETRDQLRILDGLGCDEVQGYYFSRPVPAAQFEDFLKALDGNNQFKGVEP